MPRILVFDVNETLLDLQALEPHFQSALSDGKILQQWFDQVIGYAMALTLADAYKPFGEVARAAFEMVAQAHGVKLCEEDAQQIVAGIRSLPPHRDVVESLTRLKSAGFRMVTLTNSPAAIVDAQMANAQLQPFFERNFSVDSVRKYKPDPAPYRMVARELGVDIGQLRMIAAHAWDVGGALQAGCAAAFIAREGKALFPLLKRPDIVGRDLREVSEEIVNMESDSRR